MYALIEAFTAVDVLMHIDAQGRELILRPGMACRVYSVRFKKWFTDGHVTSVYKNSVRVSYGLGEYFSWMSVTRGNSKLIQKEAIDEFLEFPKPVYTSKEPVKSELRLDLSEERLPS